MGAHASPARTWLVVAVAAVLAIVLTGCSGNDDDTAPEPERLTRAELIRQGDAICAKAVTEIQALPQDDFRTFITRGHEIFADQVRQLRALRPPEDAEQLYGEFLGHFDEVVEQSEEASRQAEGGDVEAARKTYEGSAGSASQARQIAASYGFRACSGQAANS